VTASHRTASIAALALALALPACAPPRPDVPRPARALELRALEGTWYVLESTFPMWFSGTKTDPAFHYRVIADYGGALLLDDRVSYFDKDRPEAIEGIDTPDPADATHLTWRGKGLLSLFTSDWYVVMRAPDDRWAVIYFSSTIATPEGVDIIARTPSLPAETLAEIRAAIFADPGLRRRAAGLAPVRRRTP
jgi:lipocalin